MRVRTIREQTYGRTAPPVRTRMEKGIHWKGEEKKAVKAGKKNPTTNSVGE